MLETIKGKLEAKYEDYLILNNGGWGLKIYMCRRDLLKMPKVRSIVKLFTHFSLRFKSQEIELLIFGFLKKEDRDFFRELLKKNQIGVKIAFSILNFASHSQIKNALKKGDINFFKDCKGIPKKAIKNLFLEHSLVEEFKKNKISEEDKKIIAALKKLGYGAVEAKEAILKIPTQVKSLQNRLKEALKILNQ